MELDFVVTGNELEFEFVKQVFSEKCPKVRGIMEPDLSGAKEVAILDRAVRWEDGEVRGGPAARRENVGGREANRLQTIPGSRQEAGHSQDRPDIRYSNQELRRRMANPTAKDWGNLEKLRRYLKGRPRMIQRRMKDRWNRSSSRPAWVRNKPDAQGPEGRRPAGLCLRAACA